MNSLIKTCYLDANTLIYFKNEDSPFYSKTSILIEHLVIEDYRLFISSLVIDEFLYGFKFHLGNKKIKKKDIFISLNKALLEILALPNLELVNPPSGKNFQLKVIEMMKDFNLFPRDAYHLLMMIENKIKFFATFDDDFKEAFRKKIIFPVQL